MIDYIVLDADGYCSNVVDAIGYPFFKLIPCIGTKKIMEKGIGQNEISEAYLNPLSFLRKFTL